jgi:hypothetical protein
MAIIVGVKALLAIGGLSGVRYRPQRCCEKLLRAKALSLGGGTPSAQPSVLPSLAKRICQVFQENRSDSAGPGKR